MSVPTLIIRTDATVQMGTGHLMRCLALAQCWQSQGGEVIFLTACDQTRLLRRLYDEKFLVHKVEAPHPNPNDVQNLLQVAANYEGAWIALDGYHFDAGYQRAIRAARHPLLVIDDLGQLPEYHCNIILNQSSTKIRYPVGPDTLQLLGPQYAILRQEFRGHAPQKREFSVVRQRVLVTMGGSDPFNVATRVVEALNSVTTDKLEVIVAGGTANPHGAALADAVARSIHQCRLQVDAHDMAELMTWADVAISAGGSTTWELAATGLPSFLITLSDNQKDSVHEMVKHKAALHLGELKQVVWNALGKQVLALLKSPAQRTEMSRAASALVDGNGVDRLIAAITQTRSLAA